MIARLLTIAFFFLLSTQGSSQELKFDKSILTVKELYGESGNSDYSINLKLKPTEKMSFPYSVKVIIDKNLSLATEGEDFLLLNTSVTFESKYDLSKKINFKIVKDILQEENDEFFRMQAKSLGNQALEASCTVRIVNARPPSKLKIDNPFSPRATIAAGFNINLIDVSESSGVYGAISVTYAPKRSAKSTKASLLRVSKRKNYKDSVQNKSKDKVKPRMGAFGSKFLSNGFFSNGLVQRQYYFNESLPTFRSSMIQQTVLSGPLELNSTDTSTILLRSFSRTDQTNISAFSAFMRFNGLLVGSKKVRLYGGIEWQFLSRSFKSTTTLELLRSDTIKVLGYVQDVPFSGTESTVKRNIVNGLFGVNFDFLYSVGSVNVGVNASIGYMTPSTSIIYSPSSDGYYSFDISLLERKSGVEVRFISLGNLPSDSPFVSVTVAKLVNLSDLGSLLKSGV